jgi:hypothetical protein
MSYPSLAEGTREERFGSLTSTSSSFPGHRVPVAIPAPFDPYCFPGRSMTSMVSSSSSWTFPLLFLILQPSADVDRRRSPQVLAADPLRWLPAPRVAWNGIPAATRISHALSRVLVRPQSTGPCSPAATVSPRSRQGLLKYSASCT